jgi:hypothetical protein
MSDPQWVRVNTGLYAYGSYRVQRTSRGWRWWHVVRLTPTAPRGHEPTLREAMRAVEALT